ELAKAVRNARGGLGVQDAGVVVGVERRDAGLGTAADSSVRLRAAGQLERPDARVVDVDPDPGRDADLLAVHEDVEMRVHVMDERLTPLRLQAGGDGAAHRVGGRSPRRRALRWRRSWACEPRIDS